MAEDDNANVGMLPMVATPQRKEIMASYFTLTLSDSDRLPPDKIMAFAAVAISLGLNPLAGELMIIEKRLYVTVDGRRRLAMRNDDFAAIQPSIVTDEATRVSMGATRRGDILAACRLWRKSTPMASTQYGLVREAERWPSKDRTGHRTGGQGTYTISGEQTKLGLTDDQVAAAKANHDPDSLFDLATDPAAKVRPILTQPAIMAMKRAEARALSLMASVALPTYDPDVGAPIDDVGPNGDGNVIEGDLVEPEPDPLRPDEPVPMPRPAEPQPPPPPPAADLSERGLPGQTDSPPTASTASEPPDIVAPPVGDEPEALPGAAAAPTDHMTRAAPAAGPRRTPTAKRAGPVGGGLVRAPSTVENLIRYAISNLHYRNTAAILAALGKADQTEITDLEGAWDDLVKLAPAGTPA